MVEVSLVSLPGNALGDGQDRPGSPIGEGLQLRAEGDLGHRRNLLVLLSWERPRWWPDHATSPVEEVSWPWPKTLLQLRVRGNFDHRQDLLGLCARDHPWWWPRPPHRGSNPAKAVGNFGWDHLGIPTKGGARPSPKLARKVSRWQKKKGKEFPRACECHRSFEL